MILDDRRDFNAVRFRQELPRRFTKSSESNRSAESREHGPNIRFITWKFSWWRKWMAVCSQLDNLWRTSWAPLQA